MASITAPSITLRSTKGSPLTNAEVDANFSNISTQIALGQTAASYTAADVLAKLITVDGAGSLLDADFLDGLNSATANTASTIVARDASGNFSAGTITATAFSGTFNGVAGITSGSITLTTALALGSGGTGATTAAGARTALGLAIGTDVQAYSANLAAEAGVTSAANKLTYWTGANTAAVTDFSAYGRTLVDDADAATARTTLGLVIGTNVQAYGAQLSAVSGIATGMVALTGAGTAAGRTITAGAGISVTNGDGTAGNPTIAANVTSVQGNTGAVIVSVPVTSVQGNTGAVIVTNISGNAGSASSGWPGSLSQFSNNLGNYGAWTPHGTRYHGISYHTNNCMSVMGNSRGYHNHGQPNGTHYGWNCYNVLYQDTGLGMDMYHQQINCRNCNCNC
jgi:hypothetical protein